MTNPTGFYLPGAHCPGHQWRKRDEDDTTEYYECVHCGETKSKVKL